MAKNLTVAPDKRKQPVRRRTHGMRWFLFPAVLVLLAGCQCFSSITVSGSLEQGVVFHAPTSAGPHVGGTALLRLTVVAAGAAADTKPLWQITGKARVEALAYGVVPPGMSEEAPAVRLERGGTYIVAVEGSTGGVLPGPSCRGKVRFAVASDGTISACYEQESACG